MTLLDAARLVLEAGPDDLMDALGWLEDAVQEAEQAEQAESETPVNPLEGTASPKQRVAQLLAEAAKTNPHAQDAMAPLPKPIELYVVVDQAGEVQGHADSIGAAYKIAADQLVDYVDYDRYVIGVKEGETRRIVRMVEAQ